MGRPIPAPVRYFGGLPLQSAGTNFAEMPMECSPRSPERTRTRASWTSRANRETGGSGICVADEGPGVTSTANLFVPFFTTKAGGSGIGLALSRQIAEAHQGSLALENRRDRRGARARLRLPL